jgi:hypothetical protein
MSDYKKYLELKMKLLKMMSWRDYERGKNEKG